MSEGPPVETTQDAGTGTWVVTIWADRDYHELVLARQPADAPATPGEFPAALAPREVVLRADEVRIGRARDPAGGDVPEIDLAGPPRDPGVSALHAVLLALPRDRWVVMDAGSTNGTTLNYAEDPLAPDTPVPLRSGDTIHVGAWTTLTVERR
ncbi:FHA domain-containing protein [Actinomycetospora cinnamomea]|uniref:FHA domain-containing protein n=1 Tax=Actinomycetospora cinnamomea TaxID=663609 RepID=A0A2U1FBM2_9PSEU|nr:FHA domain-containing protein [Actinomycetospora cinnamomea]PVZ09582.1 FHA domain-containing protein [Actinomycetospora cinnamomea]